MRKFVSVIIGAIGLVLFGTAVALTVESRSMARAATASAPSPLWSVVVERGMVPFSLPEDGSDPEPAALARTISRGLLVGGGVGLFFLVAGLVFFLRPGPPRTVPPASLPTSGPRA